MKREFLREQLHSYIPVDDHELAMKGIITQFVEQYEECFERSLAIGHITASSMIVNKDKTKGLFTHHHKLDKWLQLGGHSDGDPNPLNVALREAQEESGLRSIIPLSEHIFDVDAHEIPTRKNEPAHIHYDIRFLFEADDSEQLMISSESKDLAWILFDEIEQFTTEESVLRMVRKVKQGVEHN